MYVISTIAAGILWGCISIFLKTLTASGLSSLQVMGFRSVLSAAMLFFLSINKR